MALSLQPSELIKLGYGASQSDVDLKAKPYKGQIYMLSKFGKYHLLDLSTMKITPGPASNEIQDALGGQRVMSTQDMNKTVTTNAGITTTTYTPKPRTPSKKKPTPNPNPQPRDALGRFLPKPPPPPKPKPKPRPKPAPVKPTPQPSQVNPAPPQVNPAYKFKGKHTSVAEKIARHNIGLFSAIRHTVSDKAKSRIFNIKQSLKPENLLAPIIGKTLATVVARARGASKLDLLHAAGIKHRFYGDELAEKDDKSKKLTKQDINYERRLEKVPGEPVGGFHSTLVRIMTNTDKTNVLLGEIKAHFIKSERKADLKSDFAEEDKIEKNAFRKNLLAVLGMKQKGDSVKPEEKESTIKIGTGTAAAAGAVAGGLLPTIIGGAKGIIKGVGAAVTGAAKQIIKLGKGAVTEGRAIAAGEEVAEGSGVLASLPAILATGITAGIAYAVDSDVKKHQRDAAITRATAKNETGVDIEDFTKSQKAFGQVKVDTAGTKSYGILGLNTKGQLSAFVKANPQLGLTAPMGSDEFDAQWRSQASNPAMRKAQIDWYEKQIDEISEKLIKQGVPPSLAENTKVIAYFSDRNDQVGDIGTVAKNTLKAHPEDYNNVDKFLRDVALQEKQNLGKTFKTYLGKYPDRRKGLSNRVDHRLSAALSMNDIKPVQQSVGGFIDETSKNVLDLKEAKNVPVVIAAPSTTVVQSPNRAPIGPAASVRNDEPTHNTIGSVTGWWPSGS